MLGPGGQLALACRLGARQSLEPGGELGQHPLVEPGADAANVEQSRSVVGPEWDALAAGTLGDSINPWGVEMFRTISTVDPKTDTEQSAYDRWMDQTSDREQARVDRVHGAEGIIPTPLWLALFLICGVIFVYMLFFADPGEHAVTQGLLMGSVTCVITVLMLLLMFFNHPHGSGVGRLQPTAMERTLRLIDLQLDLVGLDLVPPCDEHGRQ